MLAFRVCRFVGVGGYSMSVGRIDACGSQEELSFFLCDHPLQL